MHFGQTTEDEKISEISFTKMSIVFGIDTPRAQASRRILTTAFSENCGE
jgi:hypothetical protein